MFRMRINNIIIIKRRGFDGGDQSCERKETRAGKMKNQIFVFRNIKNLAVRDKLATLYVYSWEEAVKFVPKKV